MSTKVAFKAANYALNRDIVHVSFVPAACHSARASSIFTVINLCEHLTIHHRREHSAVGLKKCAVPHAYRARYRTLSEHCVSTLLKLPHAPTTVINTDRQAVA